MIISNDWHPLDIFNVHHHFGPKNICSFNNNNNNNIDIIIAAIELAQIDNFQNLLNRARVIPSGLSYLWHFQHLAFNIKRKENNMEWTIKKQTGTKLREYLSPGFNLAVLGHT